ASPRSGAKELAVLFASGLLQAPSSRDPWAALRGYSHLGSPSYPVLLSGEEQPQRYGVCILGAERFRLSIGQDSVDLRVRAEGAGWHITGKGINLRARTVAIPNGVAVLSLGRVSTFAFADPFLLAEEAGGGADRLNAPMPGLVKSVRVSTGETVRKGQILLVLEAMKMEHTITAPHDGRIAEIVTESAQVKENSPLVRFETPA
ncbi:MAG: biotin/lipoyl-containing protein, partial [Alphaproteobacteria bacterium]